MTQQTATAVLPGTAALRRGVAIVIGTALVAAAAQFEFRLPFSPVPLTLQGGALLFVGLVLGARKGAAALVTYLVAGAAGLPVFSGGSSGLAHLMGPTAGYLFAFPVAAGLAGWMAEGQWGPAAARYLVGAVLGMLVVHLGGWSWLTVVTGDATRAFALGTVPFGASDLAELVLGASLALAAGPRLRRLI